MDRYLKEQQERTLKKLSDAIERYNEKEEDVIEKFMKGEPVENEMEIMDLDDSQMVAYLLMVRQRKMDLVSSLLHTCKDLLNIIYERKLTPEETAILQSVYRGLYVCSDLGSDEIEK